MRVQVTVVHETTIYATVEVEVEDTDLDTVAEALTDELMSGADWQISDGNIIRARDVQIMRDTIAPSPDLAGDLRVADGVVVVSLEKAGEIEEVARFSTIASAEEYLGRSNLIDPDDLAAGHYSICAPHGLGSDSEAIPLVKKLGYNLFYSMGSRYYAPPGVAVSNNFSGKGWKSGKGDESFEEMALRILATIEP